MPSDSPYDFPTAAFIAVFALSLVFFRLSRRTTKVLPATGPVVELWNSRGGLSLAGGDIVFDFLEYDGRVDDGKERKFPIHITVSDIKSIRKDVEKGRATYDIKMDSNEHHRMVVADENVPRFEEFMQRLRLSAEPIKRCPFCEAEITGPKGVCDSCSLMGRRYG